MGKSLIRKNQLSTDIADLVGQYGSGFFVSTSQTGSFTASLTGANVVYTTGDQTVSGLKTFEGSIAFYKDGSLYFAGYDDYGTQINGTSSGVTLSTFQKPTDITVRTNFVGGNYDNIISIVNSYYTDTIFGQSINSTDDIGDQIIIYQTGSIYGVPGSKGPYLRLGKHNIISEKSDSKLGIGTTFPQEKVHISGGNLRVDGGTSFSNRPTVNGTGVLLQGEATAGGSVTGVVYTTGNQTISGTKTFVSNTVLYSGINVTFDKDTNVIFSGTPTFNSGINSNILFNKQTTNFNFDNSMNGKMILVNSASTVTATLVGGLKDGYNVSLTQVGAGKITIAANSPASRQQRLGLYSSAGQYAVISLINTGNNGFLLYGDLN